MKQGTFRYNTNLSAEFWVLSALYRLGMEAHLTLGNKKSVDIFVLGNSKTILTIDVKGLASAYAWPADNINIFDDPTHFYTLLSFEGKISDPSSSPSVWIIPSNRIKYFIKRGKTRCWIPKGLVKRDGSEFENAWSSLI